MSGDVLSQPDVRFDQVAAQAAAAECERAARLLRDATSRWHGLAEAALTNGRGPWRDELHRRIAGTNQRSAELERKLRAVANALHDACQRASAAGGTN